MSNTDSTVTPTWPKRGTLDFAFNVNCPGPTDELPFPPDPTDLAAFILGQLAIQGFVPVSDREVHPEAFTRGLTTLAMLGWTLRIDGNVYRLVADGDTRGSLSHLRQIVQSSPHGQHWLAQVRDRLAIPLFAAMAHLRYTNEWQQRAAKAQRRCEKAASKKQAVAA